MNPHGWPTYPFHPDAMAEAVWRRTAPLEELEAAVAEFCDEGDRMPPPLTNRDPGDESDHA